MRLIGACGLMEQSLSLGGQIKFKRRSRRGAFLILCDEVLTNCVG